MFNSGDRISKEKKIAKFSVSSQGAHNSDIYLDRPAVMPLIGGSKGVLANFGAGDEAVRIIFWAVSLR
jgi:hypothetical protein